MGSPDETQSSGVSGHPGSLGHRSQGLVGRAPAPGPGPLSPISALLFISTFLHVF